MIADNIDVGKVALSELNVKDSNEAYVVKMDGSWLWLVKNIVDN